jgi:hypothetical protein
MLKRGDLIYRFMDSAGKKDEAATPPSSNGGGQPSLEPDEEKPRKDAAPYPAQPGSSI